MTISNGWSRAAAPVLLALTCLLGACGGTNVAPQEADSSFTTLTGGGLEHVHALEFTYDGGYVLGGTFQGTTNIAGTEFTATGDGELFITKMDRNRRDVEWTATARAELGIDLGGVAVLDDGSIMIAGSIGGVAVFGDMTVSNSNQDWDGFVAKLDSTGNWMWAQNAGGPGFDTSTGIAASNNGDVIVVGMFTLDASFGGTKLRSVGDGYDAYVAKIGSDGTWKWVLAGGGPGREGAVSVSSTDDGGAYVVGGFDADTTIGDIPLTRVDGMTDAFVAKVSSSGKWSWATGLAGHNYDFAAGAKTSVDGGVVVSMRVEDTVRYGDTGYAGSMQFAKLDSSGAVVWRTPSVDSNSNQVLDLERSGDNFVAVGWFADTLELDGDSRTAFDRRDMMIVSVSADGELSWMCSVGGFYNDAATQVGVDRSGGLLIVGSHQSTIVIDGTSIRSNGWLGDTVLFPCDSR